jgi:hypothetical protein
VRHTGGDRRRRLPAPREQHRHEQLEPLHQYIRSFAHTADCRAGWPERTVPCVPPVAVYPRRYAVSTLDYPQLSAA